MTSESASEAFTPTSTGYRSLLLLAFFLSGAAALTYEIVWSRQLLLVLGHTAVTSALLLALFVGSLGLGARWAGPRVDRLGPRRSLRFYVRCELLAALLAWLAPQWILASTPLYVSLASGMGEWMHMPLRMLIAAIAVVPCAFLLGATLPAMVIAWQTKPGNAGRSTAPLYGVNTIGAVVGCFVAGMVVMERFGVAAVLWMGVGLGLLASAIAFVVSTIQAEGLASSAASPRSTPKSTPSLGDARTLALLCGFIGLGCELAGFRILVFFLEGFTTAFTAMLGIFIAGLGLGSLLLGPIVTRRTRPRYVLALLLTAFAVIALADVYLLLPHFESVMRSIKAEQFADVRTPADIASALGTSATLGSACLLLLPACLLGATFPLCVRIAEAEGASPGEAVGATYLFNSVGTVAAPLVCSFVLMPWKGVLATWAAIACLALFVAFLLVVRPRVPRLAFALAFVAAVLVPLPMTDATTLVCHSAVMQGRDGRQLTSVSTDATTTVSVVDLPGGERYLYTDDFPAAATGASYRYMRMLGHLPCLLAPSPERVMVIAFGTGTTAGAVAMHEEAKEITVVEVSPGVLRAADHFEHVNRRVLADGRVRVRRDDGRNALLLRDTPLDVITLEPLMPYSPHGLPFYTREFYELCAQQLAPDGIVCQWVPVHAMPADLYAAFLRTFFEVFPEGSLWFFEQSTALIGRKSKGVYPSGAAWARRVKAIESDLKASGFATLRSLAAAYVASGRSVLTLPAPGVNASDFRVIADADPYPEFSPTPRARLNTPYLHRTLAYLATLVEERDQPAGQPWWPGEEGSSIRSATKSALAARWRDGEAAFLSVSLRALPPGHPEIPAVKELRDRALDQAADGYAKARTWIPGDAVLAWRRVRALRRQALSAGLSLLGRAQRQDTTKEERADALKQAERLLDASLPPILPDSDPVVSERLDVLKAYVAAALRRGHCEHAAYAITRCSEGTWPPAAASQLERLRGALRARMEDPQAEVPAGLAWVFADAQPCGESVEARISPALGELRSALDPTRARALRTIRTAALRVQALADEHGALGASIVSARIPDLVGPDTPASHRALMAGLQRALSATDETLLGLLTEGPVEQRRAAIDEIVSWRLRKAFAAELVQLLGHRDATIRLHAAKAAGAGHAIPALLYACATCLNDAAPDVRKEAWSAFLRHYPDVVKGYSPGADEETRAGYVTRAQQRLAR